ncbi:winged helix-turn-helix domain-containing protein [Dokdonella sp.]|uniref:winged helix-turn-helix domain-containing protein n=1 Tax=Dokdonella sp. TaxID=2291710 RepID=UPI001B1C51C1|nr:winged helix-turn-helix domain-containing protein [Dokdonella sp.]MBO9663951.1 winged helix-turn-helix domain-containing protein [Dokdonella sp.]
MTASRYLFHDFCLDPAARELRRHGELVVLPVSSIDCLAYLIAHRERAVGRDELIAAVWGRTDVADTLLAQTVLRIRRALGETGGEQSSIRTVPRFGYRWTADTQVEEGAAAVAPEPAEVAASAAPENIRVAASVPTPSVVPRSKRRLAFAAAALLLAALAGGWLWHSRQVSQPLAGEGERVAAYVMPAQAPDAAEWSWLRLGLMDLVAGRLRAGGLATAPAESVLTVLKQSGSPPPAFADALEVVPSAEFHGNRWQVSLAARHGEERILAKAEADDVLGAGRIAADQLLIKLGYQPPPARDAPSTLALQELLQRTKAAILADQFDLARSLIAQTAPELRQSPEVALRLAQIEMGEGRYESVQQQATALLDRLPRDADASLHGRILNLLGGAQVRLARYAEADASYEEALGVLRAVDDPIGLAIAYTGRAAVAAQREDLERATAELGRARVEFAAGADALGVAHTDMNLGLVAAQRYRVAQSLPMLRQAEARLRELGAREESVYASFAMIGVQLQLLDYAAARALSDGNWPPEAHTGNERLRWQLVLARAHVLLVEGRLAEAAEQLDRLERESSPTQDAATRTIARALAARVALQRGNFAQAAERAQSALTASLRSDEPDTYLLTWLVQARALRGGARLDEAGQQTAALRIWVDANPSEWRQLEATLAEAEQAWAEGRRDDALAKFTDANQRADRLGVPEDRVEVAAAAVPALIAADQLDRASAVVGTIATWAPVDFRAAWAEAQLLRALGRTEEWQRAYERASALARERVVPALRESGVAAK